MWAQKLQKITSFFLIFFLLFSMTLRVPLELFFGYQAYADEKEFYDLVSIIVDEDTYSDVKNTLVQYSRDIQGVLENTRVVIIPTPSDASVLDIASLNESLYFEGYKSHKDVDFESRLVGTVLVGKIPVPIVFDDGSSAKSILPFVDFEDKSFIFDHETGKYEKNNLADTRITPEIWHGVISPNTGDKDEDITAIRDYFEKNHDFYIGDGVFESEKGILNGRDSEVPENYQPFVFYYDQFRETNAIQYENYVGYQTYLQNIEDITYNRYSKELAEKVKDQILGIQNADIVDLLVAVDPEFDISGISSGPDTSASSDVLTRYITDNATKKFLEIFNGTTLGDMRKNVYNAGRYNDGGSRVNMDMPPFLISVLDQVSSEVVKNVNTSLEREITDIVANGLSRKIAIAENRMQTGGPTSGCSQIFTNYYYGTPGVNITSAGQCSVYLGSTQSGTLVEANRGYNINNVGPDTELCGAGMQYDSVQGQVTNGLNGYWSGNSPVNMSGNGGTYDSYVLGDHDLQKGIRTVFDVLGSKEIDDETKIPSPLDCFEDNTTIQTYKSFPHTYTTGSGDDEETVTICRLKYNLPVQVGDPVQFYQVYPSESSVTGSETAPAGTTSVSRFCRHNNDIVTPLTPHSEVFGESIPVESCTTITFTLDGTSFMTVADPNIGQSTGGEDSEPLCPSPRTQTVNYNTIPSHILHTSPTDSEFGAQIESLFTPSLPIDKIRYIDFIGAKGGSATEDYGYERIDFPRLFGVNSIDPENITLENIAESTKRHLDSISAQINSVITSADPSSLSGKELDLYNLLKTGDYPAANIDLYQMLQDKPLEVFTIDNESKEVSYYDTLIFAIYWNNLNTVSSKYKFIFENYLSNQFTGNDYKFHLPKSKKSYEVGYYAAPGDEQNMYIKLDPEIKGVHPYASIVSQNIEFNGVLTASSVATPTVEGTGAFECGPPDGVPIWQWIPAVICWLSNMLPPTIKISEGHCGASLLSDEEKAEILACEGDVNNNGVNDCIENALGSGSLNLSSDSGRYYYFTPGVLTTKIRDNDGDIFTIDNINYVDTSLSKVEIPLNSEQAFTGDNVVVIYDRDIPELATPESLKLAQKYVGFTNHRVRANAGVTTSYFYGKGEDANVYFTSEILVVDTNGETAIDLTSNTQKIQIRGDRVFVNTYKIQEDESYISDSSIGASGDENMCIVDGNTLSLEQAVTQAGSISAAREKLLLSLENYSKAGNNLPINYPISLSLTHDNEVIFSQSDINASTVEDVYPFLAATKAGRYELSLTDASGFTSYKNIDVLPDRATTIDPILSTSVVEAGGNISTHLFSILDIYGNAASGEIYSIDISIDGDGILFDENGGKNISYNIVDGYKAFRLASTDQPDTNTITFTLKDISGNTIDEVSKDIDTVAQIQLQVEQLSGTPKVGGDLYNYKLTFTDELGNTLTNLNSRAYMVINKLYGNVDRVYSDVVGGVAEIGFRSSTLAVQDALFEFQLEGGNEIYTYQTDILPEAPIKIDLHVSRDKIEASTTDSSILEAILKDRYNNEVFNDSTTKLNLEIHDNSQAYITTPVNQKTVSDGKVQFQLFGTSTPGIGYFKVSSDPDLSDNSFELIGQAPFDTERLVIPTMLTGSGNLSETGKLFYKQYSSSKYISKFVSELHLITSNVYLDLSPVLQEDVLEFWKETNALTVNGLGENAGMIETFFFWDKNDIDGNSYNTLYSVLLGAPYGDITQQDYLAGAMLFDRDNAALAVSSLMNSPYRYSDILSLETDGFIKALRSGDITQDIQLEANIDGEGRLIIDIFNAALDSYIGRLYYNTDETSNIFMEAEESLGYTLTTLGDNVILKNTNGKTYFQANENGRFEKKSATTLALDFNYTGEGVKILLQSGRDTIGTFTLKGNFDTNITRDETLLSNKLSTLDNTLIIHLKSNQYSSREVLVGGTQKVVKIHYHDPFGDPEALDDFHGNDIAGIESILEEEGIGWKDSNTLLLNFAAGESVGNAAQHFQSFSFINLGDPVVSLTKIQPTFSGTDTKKSFDPTLGDLIVDADDMIGFLNFDFNSDLREDLLTIHTSGYIDIYENKNTDTRYVKHSSLVFAADGGSSRLVKTGDFTGDGFDDIFFVTETGDPALFNNIEKDFRRTDISEEFSLSGAIVQVESFDMDNDNIDDIITLDDAGEIHIFYGGGTPENPDFTKKFIGDGYAIELSETTTSHGGAVYFEGLSQINPDDLTSIYEESLNYIEEVNEVIASGSGVYDPDATTPNPEFIDTSLVNSLLYVGLPYIPTDYEIDTLESELLLEEVEAELGEIGGSPEGEAVVGETTAALEGFIESYGDYIEYSGYSQVYNTQTYFLRSQYADLENLEISKIFSDVTPPYLQSGDRVHMDITLKNTGTKTLNNIAYVDNIPKYFEFVDNEFTVLTEDDTVLERKSGISEYNVIIDGFFLEPGEETTIRIVLNTLPLSYGHIQVGLYEQGEVGDDVYGDIILKEDNKNCGKQADIFRSIAQRDYLKGTTTPTCDEAAIDIGNTFPELTDADYDGIPDYLQQFLVEDEDGNLVPTTNSGSIEEYTSTTLTELYNDSDGDGIPDSDDSMDSTSSATDFMGALDVINGAIDDIAGEIDQVIEGLSCGFGGGSCFANPLNWAPLAPGNDPTLFGMPIGDGLRVNEGMPLFSALTGRQASCGRSPCCLPSVYPANSQAFIPGPFCGPNSAGGNLGVWAPTNFVRLFATPTLTGGFGIAVCFGGPALASGNVPPMGVHPVVPGGNCIVAAMPLFGCEGGEGDPEVLGYPYWGDFGIIHANCDGETGQLYTPAEVESAFVQDYLEFLQTGIQPPTMYENYVSAMSAVSDTGGANFTLSTQPLINIGGGTDGMMSTSVDLDVSALANGNFEDVIDIKNKRIGGFPNFLMDWVERQLDEITSKLTNLPKIFVVLPEFGGIFDYGWEDFGSGMKEAFEKGKAEKQADKDSTTGEVEALKVSKSGLDCSGGDALRCRMVELKVASVNGKQKLNGSKETLSGIKEVYEFIGNIPLVDVETETIHVNVPWIEGSEIDRFLVDWKYSLEQYKQEIGTAKDAWSFGAACSGTPEEIERCQRDNDIKKKASLQADAFLDSLETNIQTLEEYKEFPKKLAKLINIKEVWLEQILCNIEAISTLLGGWINDNGERFKAWVELYILIKAALKSWQLFIDVFNGYEEECHECKNERQDLQNFIFRLISMVIPSPPIIQFPKWPDIILDFHNIRAGMTIHMPDFEMNLRPIVLPDLPPLNLPAVPSIDFNLPALPLLPQFSIPELPDLPSLPTIELPDLPPPPKIPKIFGAVEAVLNIAKLVTKAMCLLKNSPFVPEWRAGDQIAFLTERNGYLPTDFIDIQPPAFSYSTVSAIKVTTYVNFEFEMDFIVEAVRSIVAPLDEITNNISNAFNIQISNINLTEAVPSDININVDGDGVELEDISFAPLNKNPQGAEVIAGMLVGAFINFIKYLDTTGQETLGNKEFLAFVSQELSSDVVTSDPATRELQDLWREVSQFTYSKEDTFIKELEENRKQKFQILGDIISTEIEYSKKQQEQLEDLGSPEFITAVSRESNTRIEGYNELLEPYNIKTLDAAINLVSGESQESQEFRAEIQSRGKELMSSVRGGLNRYRDNSNFLASHVAGHEDVSEPLSCNAVGRPYQYTYEGIYVLEDGRNYKLFDYTDPLRGDEIPQMIDVDNDGDDDVVYLMDGRLYKKENYKETPTQSFVSGPPLILDADDNTFYNGEIYYEAINGFAEAGVSDGYVNIEFQRPTNTALKNFRLSYHTIVDRYLHLENDYQPEFVTTHIVDAITDSEDTTIIEENPDYTISKNEAVLVYAGAMNDLKLTTHKLQNIREQLSENTQVTLTSGAKIYAAGDGFEIDYIDGDETVSVSVPAYSSLSFDSLTEVVGIDGDGYVSLGILEDIYGTDIINYIGKPLSLGATLEYEGDGIGLDSSSHIDIRYYDGSEIALDMRDISSYTLYDLGDTISDEYRIRLEVPNDFYYAKIGAFQNDILGTLSRQILLAPQVESDNFAPQIGLNQKIRIPVYQRQKVDLTPYIYEDGGLSGIAEVRVDFDLDIDLDGDGDNQNDSNTGSINIIRSPIKIEIEFGPYDTLFEKNILISLIDNNGNIGEKQVGFQVYTPNPQIDDIDDHTIIGKIDESLLDEPVRLYRYRGGVVEKLQKFGGGDLVETNETGHYNFETSETASGLTLTHSGVTLATIDEYTGKIELLSALAQIDVVPTNDENNESVYPEIRILFASNPVFRQFVKMPERQVRVVSDFNDLEEIATYVKLIDQESYGIEEIPLGVPINPGSLVVYSNDNPSVSLMTVFNDGRIHTDLPGHDLIYREMGERTSLVLIDTSTGAEIAQVVFYLDASYILN